MSCACADCANTSRCACDNGRDRRGGPCNRCNWDIGNSFARDERVELHPATDRWMMGDRYGEVAHFDALRGTVRVRLDKSGRTLPFAANLVKAI
jgi:hypothetical protein